MTVLENQASCCGCQACYNICPAQAIQMKTDEEGFLVPVIDDHICLHCDRCRSVCPVLNPPAVQPTIKIYIGYAKDLDERETSSSGGVFAVLSRAILQEGGVVCGAAYDDKLSVHHIFADSDAVLGKLKGTKYVQSSVEKTYSAVREYLRQDRTVIFSGTPCQVAGLKSFLGRDYERLLCVDLVCHGVPAPAVWHDYLDELGKEDRVTAAAFRCKKQGSEKPYICFQHESGKRTEVVQSNNLYMKGFINNYYVRNSCYSCRFKGWERCSDITIGDFWSAKEFHPQFADRHGNSAIIVHTDKGMAWMNAISDSMALESATEKELLCWNECIIQSVKKTAQRDSFYQNWRKEPLSDLISRLADETARQHQAYTDSDKPTIIKKRIKSFLRDLIKGYGQR